MSEFIFVYIPHPSQSSAEETAEALLEQGLIACANISQIQSVYRWQGKVEKAPEFVLLCKTQAVHIERIEEVVGKLHPYELPCIAQLPVAFNPTFAQWVAEETNS